MQTSQPCVNCGQAVQTNFCPECGQITHVRPITWKGLIQELSVGLLGINNRLARTFINMTIRPATVITEFLAGNRIKYFAPLSYLVVMSALYILSFGWFGLSAEDFMGDAINSFQSTQLHENPEIAAKQQEFIDEYTRIFSSNMRLVVVSIIPFLALSLSLFYRDRNYLQYFLVASYITSHMLWLSIVLLAILALTGYLTFTISLIATIGFFVWVIGTLNQEGNRMWSYIKALICWCIAYIFFVIAMSILAIFMAIVVFTQS